MVSSKSDRLALAENIIKQIPVNNSGFIDVHMILGLFNNNKFIALLNTTYISNGNKYILMFSDSTYGFIGINYIIVADEYRNTGISKRLLEYHLDCILESHRKPYVAVADTSAKILNREFMRNLGFKERSKCMVKVFNMSSDKG